MRGGRPVTVLLAAASMAVASMGVHLGNNVLVVDEDFPPRRRRIAPTRRQRSSGGHYPHQGEREIARRLRQAERNAERQAARLDSLGNPAQAPVDVRDRRYLVGISRRGRYLFA